MLLTDLLAHLAQRFPKGAIVLNAEIALSGNGHPAGLVETISYEPDDEDGNDPDGSEEVPDSGEKIEGRRRVHLRFVA